LTNFVYRDEILSVDQWQQATRVHYQMGGVPFFKGGKYEEAIYELDQCITMAPNFSPEYNLMDKSLATLGRNKEALANFKGVTSLGPDLAEEYRNIGFLYLLEGIHLRRHRIYLKRLTWPHTTQR
jgi:tetratricopeptide (TPR) repeat protein